MSCIIPDNVIPDNVIIATYIWIGGNNELRTKKKTILSANIQSIQDFPEWNFDGSSTCQMLKHSDNSEILLSPVQYYKDPFYKKNAFLVLCECLSPSTKNPVPSNTRYLCNKIMKLVEKEKVWFGIEQEYTLYTKDNKLLGWKDTVPTKQGSYYCSVGTENAIGQNISDEHYVLCLQAGIQVAGTNSEVMPGQWEYQIGICEGIDVSDQLWVSRYILQKVCQRHSLIVSFDPKPLKEWNGAGCHTNISTESMRSPNGYKEICYAITKLEKRHKEHISVYGSNNNRLIGKLETSSIDTFSYGVGNRGASVRIPTKTEKEQCGYFEDRRPASDCDPYLVTLELVKTILL